MTFRYRDNRSQQLRRVTLAAVEFMGRFLQHVLPRGCAKVRYYGIWSSSSRKQLEQAHVLLSAPPTPASDSAPPTVAAPEPAAPASTAARCPHCRIGQLIVIEVLLPQRRFPP